MDAIKEALIPHSCPDGGIGRRNRLKICRPQGLRVQVPFRVPFSSQLTVPGKTALSTLKIHDFLSKCLVCLFFFCRAKNGTVHYGAGCLHCVQALRRCAPGQVPFRVPFLRSKKPFEVPLSTIQEAFFISRQLFWDPVGIGQLIIYCRYFFIPCKDLYSAPPWRALLNFFINSLFGFSLNTNVVT